MTGAGDYDQLTHDATAYAAELDRWRSLGGDLLRILKADLATSRIMGPVLCGREWAIKQRAIEGLESLLKEGTR